jgi:hypothetical protein
MRAPITSGLLLLAVLAGCGEASPVAPDPAHAPGSAGPEQPGIVLRLRPGHFRCGLPRDANGNTCLFVPDDDPGAARR